MSESMQARLYVASPNPYKGTVAQYITTDPSLLNALGPFFVFPYDRSDNAGPWRDMTFGIGVPVLGGDGWSILCRTERDDKMGFYLRDCNGRVKKIPFGHFHHAVFFSNWEHYETEVSTFVNERFVNSAVYYVTAGSITKEDRERLSGNPSLRRAQELLALVIDAHNIISGQQVYTDRLQYAEGLLNQSEQDYSVVQQLLGR